MLSVWAMERHLDFKTKNIRKSLKDFRLGSNSSHILNLVFYFVGSGSYIRQEWEVIAKVQARVAGGLN